jgi:hypothetical protein
MTIKDDKLAKKAQSMTAGVTASKLETGATITIHGHEVRITATRPDITTVQYANLARRTFDTHALNGYLDLSVFPVGTAFERPTAPVERAVIEAVTGDCCYQVRITAGSDTPRNETYSYADFITWHMDNNAKPVARLELDLDDEPDEDDSNPFETELKQRVEHLQAQPEALQYGEAVIADLRAKLEKANKAAQEAEINGQTRINALQREVGEWKAALLTQNDQHVTELLAKNEQIDRLEAKAAIVLPTCKDFCIKRDITESDLNKLTREGWQVQHMQFMVDDKLNVVLFKDVTADQPKARLTTEATAAAIYSTPVTIPVGRPPVRQPPAPQPVLNQTIIGLDDSKPVSRMLTNNGPKPGETKKIPTLQSIQERRDRDNAEIEAILDKGKAAQEALNRQFANQPNRFIPTGAQ